MIRNKITILARTSNKNTVEIVVSEEDFDKLMGELLKEGSLHMDGDTIRLDVGIKKVIIMSGNVKEPRIFTNY
jgi:hypothetical protein